jgi:hypothetical protein
MQITNETRRSVMKVAWSLFREAAKAQDPRTFADALSGAWRFIKRMAAAKKPAWMKSNSGRVELRSPIAGSAVARRYGGAAFVGGRSSHAYLASCAGR